MKLGYLKKKLHKWQFGIEVNRRYDIHLWWPFIRIWCFKLNYFPPEGEMLPNWFSPMYKGFYWYWSPPLPIITVRTIRFRRRYYSIPIKIQFKI